MAALLKIKTPHLATPTQNTSVRPSPASSPSSPSCWRLMVSVVLETKPAASSSVGPTMVSGIAFENSTSRVHHPPHDKPTKTNSSEKWRQHASTMRRSTRLFFPSFRHITSFGVPTSHTLLPMAPTRMTHTKPAAMSRSPSSPFKPSGQPIPNEHFVPPQQE